MKNMRKILFTITVVILAAAFVVSGVLVVQYLIDGKKQADRNQELADMVAAAQTATTEAPTVAPTETAATVPETEIPTEPTETKMLSQYKELYDMNGDMVGWLKIEGTKLNYPVLQHEGLDENGHDFYLYRDFDKKNSQRGAIFVKDDVDVMEPSDNIVLYGHNMADGSMFAALNAYTNKKTWEQNSLIFFDNLYEYHTYQIFAVFRTSANIGEGFTYHKFVDAEDEQAFNDYVSKCKELSEYDTGITPKYGDKLIALSTCAYIDVKGNAMDNGRLVVVAVRIS